jgi:hypothetical protein
MREIRASGSMSGDGKRSVAAWPKLPRPSSTLPDRRSALAQLTAAIGGAADLSPLISPLVFVSLFSQFVKMPHGF